jgi:hypothetical protein
VPCGASYGLAATQAIETTGVGGTARDERDGRCRFRARLVAATSAPYLLGKTTRPRARSKSWAGAKYAVPSGRHKIHTTKVAANASTAS